MPTFIKSMILSCIFLAVQLLFSQNLTSSLLDKSLREKIDNADRSDFRYIPKKAGHYSAEEWRAVIDSTWGEGMPIEKKLQFFDMCWNLIDREYPSFFHIEDQWDSFKDLYRTKRIDAQMI